MAPAGARAAPVAGRAAARARVPYGPKVDTRGLRARPRRSGHGAGELVRNDDVPGVIGGDAECELVEAVRPCDRWTCSGDAARTECQLQS